MKKILAIILSVAMIATMLALSVSAVNVVGGDTGYGVPDFSPTTGGSQNLNVQVSSVKHRYAVDVEYDTTALVLGGTIEWNAENMEYVVGEANLENETRSINVFNRSDLSVYAYATVTDTDAADGITATTTNNNFATKLTIEKATPKTAGQAKGTSGKGTIVIAVESDDWNAVAKYYASKVTDTTNTFTYATYTVTITK